MPATTIYSARRIITMNPTRPFATHVAVREGRVLGVGSLAELEGWGDYALDGRFSGKVLMPGMIEGHAHALEGTLWRSVYLGWLDRMDPGGEVWKGLKGVEAVLGRLKEEEAKLADPDAPLSGWSLDPIHLGGERLDRLRLDRVSSARPIGVMHASGHVMNVNSKALELAGLLKPGIDHEGIPLGADGLPAGELYGPDAMMMARAHVGFGGGFADADERGLLDYARLCVRAGVTTSTDLAAQLEDEVAAMMLEVTGRESFPARIVPLRVFFGLSAERLVARALELRARSTDMLRLGRVKAVADGSIQGFSARLRWPGYYNGAPNGLWYTAPDQLLDLYRRALEAGVQVHTHVNGDQATQMALDMMERALKAHPSPDHRFALQHCQLADAAQFRKMAALGMCVNLFANHHFHWGDEHYRLTVGPERAERMNACRTALDSGVAMAIHSDAPVTPLGPLFTAWQAVNRLTASGRAQGEGERIAVAEALYAITMGAARTLHLDAELGSIEIGKKADFAVLEEDPGAVDPSELKDVPVWGVVQGGRIFPAAEA